MSLRFTEQMQAYGQWIQDLAAGIERYRQWLEDTDQNTPEDELRIYESIDSLKSDRLTIAFVAEFARGKTELINAIFFSEYDRRLLPSGAGRTTMCPTELFYDTSTPQAYIRLLPIETRLTDTPLVDYRHDANQWTQFNLNLNDAESMASAFQEIVRIKSVTIERARELGLYHDNDHLLHAPDGAPPTMIDIPLWRHALISFPHPLLKQGLVILDTPGLNALGTEPELTLSMLPKAQAILFILAADSGVTKSDLEMWQHNVKPTRSGKDRGLIVVLNKVDTLWDDLKPEAQIQRMVEEQCSKVAQTFSLDSRQIFPVSAQKGLLAKIRHDQPLLQRSNILKLEQVLANEILPGQQQLVREHVKAEVGRMIKSSHELLYSRLSGIKKQLEELSALSGKNNEVIEHLMQKTREEQVAYHRNVESFQANKKLLAEQSRKLLDLISLGRLDKLVNDSRRSMSESWTTIGLKTGMKTFFDGVNGMMDEVRDYVEGMNRLVTTVYRKFHQEHGIAEIQPVLFSIEEYLRDLDKLSQEADAFRNSPITTMTEQSFVIKKFFISLVSHARNIFFKANRDAEVWSKAVLAPLVNQIKAHKEQMEKRLDNLRKINESRDTLNARMDELKKSFSGYKRHYDELAAILAIINRPLSQLDHS
jgi:uncharacterized coiled-coil DUF342 family protein